MLLNIVIGWLALDMVAILIVVYDYRHWYGRGHGRLQKDNRPPAGEGVPISRQRLAVSPDEEPIENM